MGKNQWRRDPKVSIAVVTWFWGALNAWHAMLSILNSQKVYWSRYRVGFGEKGGQERSASKMPRIDPLTPPGSLTAFACFYLFISLILLHSLYHTLTIWIDWLQLSCVVELRISTSNRLSPYAPLSLRHTRFCPKPTNLDPRSLRNVRSSPLMPNLSLKFKIVSLVPTQLNQYIWTLLWSAHRFPSFFEEAWRSKRFDSSCSFFSIPTTFFLFLFLVYARFSSYQAFSLWSPVKYFSKVLIDISTHNHRFNAIQTSYLQDLREWPTRKWFLIVSMDSKRVFEDESEPERVKDERSEVSHPKVLSLSFSPSPSSGGAEM